MQLDMFPPPAPPAPPPYVPPVTREVVTRAYGEDRILRVREDEFDPFEIEVRGVTTVIAPGFQTYTIDKPGSPYWSETGFRSFGIPTDDPDEVRAFIEAYIDRKGEFGCNGKLTRWWPRYVLQWRWRMHFELTCAKDRSKVWDQWGADKHAACWAENDAENADAIRQMIADGIDPNDVGPPPYFKGKWPRVDLRTFGEVAA